MTIIFKFVALLAISLGYSLTAFAQPYLVYTEDDFFPSLGRESITRIDLDGSNKTEIVNTSQLGRPLFITYDILSQKLVWGENSKIVKGNLDGTGLTDLATGLNLAWGVAVDSTASEVYFTEYSGNKISKVSLSGGSVTTLISSGLNNPMGIAINVSGNKIYFADKSNNAVKTSDLDGSNVTVFKNVSTPNGIFLDLANNKVYWSSSGNNSIYRSNLDGSSEETVLSGLTNPYSVHVDLQSGKIYWAEFAGNIKSANIDGSNIATLQSGLYTPRGIVVVADSATEALSIIAPSAFSSHTTNLNIKYTLGEAPLSNSVRVGFYSGITEVAHLVMIDSTSADFTIQPLSSSVSNLAISSADNFPLTPGTYDLTVSYQDSFGNTAASSTVSGITILNPTPTPTNTPTHTPTPTITATSTMTPTAPIAPTSTPTIPATNTVAPLQPTPVPTAVPVIPSLKAPKVKVKGKNIEVTLPKSKLKLPTATIYIKNASGQMVFTSRAFKLSKINTKKSIFKNLQPSSYEIYMELTYQDKNKNTLSKISKIKNVTVD